MKQQTLNSQDAATALAEAALNLVRATDETRPAAQAEFAAAQRRYDATPAGIRDLEQEVATASAQGQNAEALLERLSHARDMARAVSRVKPRAKSTDKPMSIYHAYREWTKVSGRVDRDRRILANGQTLTKEEEMERLTLSRTPQDERTRTEQNRLSVLERIARDNSRLTAQEENNYLTNKVKYDACNLVLNINAVLVGATRRDELNALRVNILREFVNQTAERSTRRDHALNILNREEEHLSPADASFADGIFTEEPSMYSHLPLSDTSKTGITPEKYAETVELVSRYERLHPRLADDEERAAAKLVTSLRQDARALNIVVQVAFTGKALPAPILASLPVAHRRAAEEGTVTPRVLTLAMLHYARLTLFGLLSERSEVKPKLYKQSGDHAFMETVQKFIPTDAAEYTDERLIERYEEVQEWEERVRTERWVVSPEEVKFSVLLTQPAPAQKPPLGLRPPLVKQPPRF